MNKFVTKSTYCAGLVTDLKVFGSQNFKRINRSYGEYLKVLLGTKVKFINEYLKKNINLKRQYILIYEAVYYFEAEYNLVSFIVA